MEKKTFPERRQFTRFTINNATISVDSLKLQLIDICFGGLSFSYSGSEKLSSSSLQYCTLTGKNNFQLEKIPLTYIADANLDQPSRAKRRCMGFGELSSNQLLQLMAFIRDNTTSSASKPFSSPSASLV